MKAYLIVTGVLFALIAFLHLLRAIDERALMSTRPLYFLSMAGLGLLAAVLSGWAWSLLRRRCST